MRWRYRRARGRFTRYASRRWRTRRGRRFGSRYRPRTRSYGKSTKSGLVKLTYETTWQWVSVSGGTAQYHAFKFNPANIPGFNDYQTVYSQFRVIKASLEVTKAAGTDSVGDAENALIVGSRPFTQNNSPIVFDKEMLEAESYVPAQEEDALRQTRWQKVIYPSTITTKFHVGFKPYTMTAGFGPLLVTSGTNPAVFQRTWEGAKWMPFTWAPTGNNKLYFIGPYIIINNVTNQGPNAPYTRPCTLTLYVQFKGQK